MLRTLDDILLAIEVIALIIISAMCSGLNVGFMALDIPTLRRKAKLGDKHAKAILPLRRKSHLVLSAVLFTNIAVVSATSLLLESKFYGLLAGLLTTVLIVIFGEILPQALFARRALPLVGKLVPVLKLMIVVTYPFSKPLQLLLDSLLKHEDGALHSRRELGILIAEHVGKKESELDDDEVEIIKGALQLSEKRVGTIMTPIKDVYWLTPSTVINPKRVDEMKASGRSRIPIFNKAQTICFGVLLVKDLIDVDFDEHPPRVDDLQLYPAQTVGAGTALDTMFRKFIGSTTQLMPIEKDDKIVGIVTIEDLVEEIVGHEIIDETDRRNKRKQAK